MDAQPKKSKFLIIWSIFWVILLTIAALWFLAMSFIGDRRPEQPLDNATAPTQAQIDDFVKKANSPTASAQDLWLYAHLISNTESRTQLPPIDDNIDQKVNDLLQKSAEMGNCDALYDQAAFNINQAFIPSQETSHRIILDKVEIYNSKTATIHNFKLLNKGVDILIALEKRNDCVYHIIEADQPNLIKYINHLEEQSTPSLPMSEYLISSYLYNPKIQQNFESYQRFSILNAHLTLKLNHNILKDDLSHNIHTTTVDPAGKATFEDFYLLLKDYLLAKLLNDTELQHKIFQKIPVSQQREFKNLSEKLVTSYQATFLSQPHQTP